MYPEENKLQQIIAEVCENLKKSNKAYNEYLAIGKTFRYAKELKKYNTLIIDLLTKNHLQFPFLLKQDADKLLYHYHTWLKKWNELAEKAKPNDDDFFAFPNEVTFPREAAKNFETAYHDSDNA
jgi:hypothetical protein